MTAGKNHLTDHWFKEWPRPSLKFCKLDSYYDFDLDRARAELDRIKKEYEFGGFPRDGQEGRTLRSYRGLGFTSREGQEDNLFDANFSYAPDGSDVPLNTKYKSEHEGEIVPVFERDFCSPTALYTGYFGEIIDKFKSLKTKVRLLELGRGGNLPPHVDFPYYEQIRIHAVITTNDQCKWEVDGEEFVLPADGSFYWIDTGRYHTVSNAGRSPRTNLSINLSPYINREGQITHRRSIDELLQSRDL